MPLEINHLPDSARQVFISENPKAGARSGRVKIDRLEKLLRKDGFEVEVTTDIDHLAKQVETAYQQESLRAVVSAGGDGTVSLVANRTPPGSPIAIMPLGTENLLSKFLDINDDPVALCRAIRRGTFTRLDAGMANGRIFLIMVGCGFDAEVVRRVHAARKGHIHHLSYVKPIFDSIRSYQYPQIRVYFDAETDQEREPLEAKWAFVVNLPRYAGGLQIVPDADGADGLLDVCTFQSGSLWSGLLYLGGIVLGQHQTWDGCVTRRTARLRIEAEEKNSVPYQLDGDPGGYLPLEIEIVPQRLTLIVKEEWAARQTEHNTTSSP